MAGFLNSWGLSLPDTLEEAMALGGPVSLLLVLMSVASLTIIVFKSLELLKARRQGRSGVARGLHQWEQGDRARAVGTVANTDGVLASLLHDTMVQRRNGAPEALIREEVQRVAAAELERLRSQLRTLEAIGTISPLLGLFGTVLGMIEAFRQMEAAGSSVDPSVLSGGIWQALLTTGVGLAVAIPTVLAHQWLDQRADAQAHDIENSITRLFTADLHAAASELRVSDRSTLDGAGNSGFARGRQPGHAT